jgi:hypothetical protein
MKKISILAIAGCLPLIFIGVLFTYLPRVAGSKVLELIKPIEYIGFIGCAVGLPIVFAYWYRLTLQQLLAMLAIMWGLLCVVVLFFPQHMDEIPTLPLYLKMLATWFISGYLPLGMVCGTIVWLIRRYLSGSKEEPL